MRALAGKAMSPKAIRQQARQKRQRVLHARRVQHRKLATGANTQQDAAATPEQVDNTNTTSTSIFSMMAGLTLIPLDSR